MSAGVPLGDDFVPDAPKAAGGVPVGDDFVPDSAVPAAKPGKLESAGRGLLSGLSLGFDDELGGALKSAFSDQTYAAARDELRAKKAATKDAHPWLYGGGELLGGAATMLVPGAGVAGGLGKAVATGAKLGAAAGLGSSDADLTKGDVGGAIKDTLLGAGLGAAGGAVAHGVGRVFTGAADRVDRTLLGDIGKGANKTVRDKIAGEGGKRAPDVAAFAREAKLDTVARDAVPLFEKGKAIQADIGAKLGKVYQTTQEHVGLGALPDKAIEKLSQVSAKYVQRGNEAAGKILNSVADDMINAISKSPSVETFHGFASSLADRAFEGMTPGASKKIQRDVSKAITGALKEYVDEAAKMSPEVAKVAKDFGKLNKDYSIVSDIVTAASQRAKKTPFPETGLRSFTLKGMAEKGYDATVGQIQRPVDKAIAWGVGKAPGAVQSAASMSRAPGALFGTQAPGHAAQALRSSMYTDPTDEEADAIARR